MARVTVRGQETGPPSYTVHPSPPNDRSVQQSRPRTENRGPALVFCSYAAWRGITGSLPIASNFFDIAVATLWASSRDCLLSFLAFAATHSAAIVIRTLITTATSDQNAIS